MDMITEASGFTLALIMFIYNQRSSDRRDDKFHERIKADQAYNLQLAQTYNKSFETCILSIANDSKGFHQLAVQALNQSVDKFELVNKSNLENSAEIFVSLKEIKEDINAIKKKIN